MVGLTLAGGYGPLNGVAGLAIDNMVGAELVLGDGRDVTVNAHSEPDLLWALRGGGGNFGVITAMHVRLHPVSSLIAGVILFPWHQAAHVMCGYDVLVSALPDELTVQLGVVSGPDGQPVVYLSPTWSGIPSASPAWIDKLQNLGTPILVQVAEMPYHGLLHLLDPYIKWGRHYEMRTRTLRRFSAQVQSKRSFRAGATRTSGVQWHLDPPLPRGLDTGAGDPNRVRHAGTHITWSNSWRHGIRSKTAAPTGAGYKRSTRTSNRTPWLAATRI